MRISQVARSVADAEELPRLIQLSENLFAASFFLMKLKRVRLNPRVQLCELVAPPK